MSNEIDIPRGDGRGFSKYLKQDLVAGLLVFLIALPLCLGISNASGFPAINGVFTAIAGGLICVFLSNSELTIKGPAAGMIAIVLGAVLDFAAQAGVKASNTDADVYMQYLPSVAAVAIVAGILQILMGLLKAGILAEMFPDAVIHGLLASIGLIILGKQLYPLLGLKPNSSTEAYEAFLELPHHITHFAPPVAIIGVSSLALLFLYPLLKSRFRICRVVPPQLIVLLLAVPASMMLLREYDGFKRSYEIMLDGQPVIQEVKALLVKVPSTITKLPKSFIGPDFSHIGEFIFWKWVIMFTLVGSLESLLSAKAVDAIDPWKRKSNLNRDLLAVGVANTTVAVIGGLPMISEIVRSSANKDYGAATRWSNFYHGLFLLVSICALPKVLNMIPLTALAAMLIYAGCRLASYKGALHMLHVGKEQLLIFASTIVGVLATDLLIGVGIGIAVKLLLGLRYGVRPHHLFTVPIAVTADEKGERIAPQDCAVFTNWLYLKKRIMLVPVEKSVTVDFSQCKFVDHTVMTRLTELQQDFAATGRQLFLTGLDAHQRFSTDELAARRLITMR